MQYYKNKFNALTDLITIHKKNLYADYTLKAQKYIGLFNDNKTEAKQLVSLIFI